MDSVLLADADEAANGVPEARREEVVVEDAGGPGVREDVGVALLEVLMGEGPVAERGARVVVLDEGHRVARAGPDHARRLPRRVHEPPPLVALHCLLQDPFGREVKGCSAAPGGSHPRLELLPVPLLVVAQGAIAVVGAVAPELPDCHHGWSLVEVVGEVPGVEARHKVEPPPVGPRRLLEPPEPLGVVLLHAVLGVVDVGSRRVDLPCGRRPHAPKPGAVVRDDALVPEGGVAVDVPRAVLILPPGRSRNVQRQG